MTKKRKKGMATGHTFVLVPKDREISARGAGEKFVLLAFDAHASAGLGEQVGRLETHVRPVGVNLRHLGQQFFVL